MTEQGDKQGDKQEHDHDDKQDDKHDDKHDEKHGEHEEGVGEDKGKGEDKDDDQHQAPSFLPTRPKPVYFHTGVSRRVDIFRAGSYFFAARGFPTRKP